MCETLTLNQQYKDENQESRKSATMGLHLSLSAATKSLLEKSVGKKYSYGGYLDNQFLAIIE
jgi:hypothetical protein